jgi:hydrogenase/urease accessory protein HupE
MLTVVAGLIWALILGFWMPAVGLFDAYDMIVIFGGTAVLATIGFGLLMQFKFDLRWIWIAALLGVTAQFFGYSSAMFASPQPNGSEDIAAGAGVVILALPATVAIVSLLWLGAALALLVRKLRRRASH